MKWVNTNPGAAADERGYWISFEGRFSIAPNYRHTIYPDSYSVRDCLGTVVEQITFDTVRDCKQWAESRAAKTRKGSL